MEEALDEQDEPEEETVPHAPFTVVVSKKVPIGWGTDGAPWSPLTERNDLRTTLPVGPGQRRRHGRPDL